MSSPLNNVYAFPGGNLPADQVLRFAIEAELDGVVVVGFRKKPDEDGHLFYVASNYGDSAAAIYALQHANLHILECSR